MVPAPSLTGRTELICVYCDKTDPMASVETAKWAESPLAQAITGTKEFRIVSHTAPARAAAGCAEK
jgi:hypothetical protein